MNSPEPVRRLVNEWAAAGRRHQQGISWPRGRWVTDFPAHTELFHRLPDRLDRQAVRAACERAAISPEDAIDAFIVAMAWGYGRVGYGCWRTRRVLGDPNAGAKLAKAARELRGRGALAAYRTMATTGRLTGLGPAFGTKYLYFCPQPVEPPAALILDQIVSGWLRSAVGLDLNPVPWSIASYRRYLDTLAQWAEDLSVEVDVIEECIFVASATGQWAPG